MKFELDWRPTVEKGCVKPDFPFCAIRIRPDTNEDMAKLEHIKSSGLKLGQSNCHNSIEYYVVIEPPDLISKGKDNWKDERMKDNDDNRVKPNYSIKCCFGFHKWKYNKERKEAVIPYETQRICMCCGKKQEAAFDGIEILWSTIQ